MIFYFDEAKTKAEERLKELNRELEPLLKERGELERMLAAMSRAQKDPTKKLTFAQRRGQIEAILREQPGLRIVDVAQILELTQARTGEIVNQLVDEGLIRKDGRHLFLV